MVGVCAFFSLAPFLRAVIPAQAGIQYAAATRFNHRQLEYWIIRLRE